MRTLARLGLLLLVATLATSCETDQPLLVTGQLVEIFFDAPGAAVDGYNVWEIYEDTLPSDGMADDVNGDGMANDLFLWCEFAGVGATASVPWTYSAEISIIKAGDIVAKRLTSDAALADGTNRACYDDLAPDSNVLTNDAFVTHDSGRCFIDKPTPQNDIVTNVICNPNSSSNFCGKNGFSGCMDIMNCSLDLSVICTSGAECTGLGSCTDTITRKFVFDDGTNRRLSQANQTLLQAENNIIYESCIGGGCSGTPPSTTPPLGLCPGFKQTMSVDFGDPVLDGVAGKCETDHPSFEIVLEKGDTIIVEAARFLNAPAPLVIPADAGPAIVAGVRIDGVKLESDEVTGTTSTGQDSSSSISFFFTAN